MEDNMDLLGKKVQHKKFGVGEIVEINDGIISVAFPEKISKFQYPKAFELFIQAIDIDVQEFIASDLKKLKEEEEEQKRIEEEARRIEEEKRAIEDAKRKEEECKNSGQRGSKPKLSFDERFGEDYHVKHLARQPILTYSEVEERFGIKISGFGRGINITDKSVVLISSIDKAKENFVYHDHWTEEGDYIYSGEGKKGDQVLSRGNKAIVDAADFGKRLYLFVKFSPKEYYFQGLFSLVNYTYEDDKDEDGNIRKEYKFRLRKIKED
jgi:hypothetical protein